jgi:hypothetical protein
MIKLSKGNSALINFAIITGILDIISKVGFYYRIASENEIGLNQQKILILVYLILGIIIISNLFKFKKLALNSYFAFWVLTILYYWYTDLSNLRVSGMIGGFLGFNFLSIFTICVLLSKRRFFIK